jgi:prepilin-type N-terminal cleavage/methylation domain-containing protein
MALAKSRWTADARGFSLIEVLMATALMVTAVASLAQLFVLSTDRNRSSKNTTFAAVLAQHKMEQLRSLTWGFDTLGLPATDTSTDTTKFPETTGGTGLSPSPVNTLQQNVVGYVDYLDAKGQTLGGATAVTPANAVYIRRWMIEPLPTNPNNTIVIQVLVTRHRDRGTADGGSVLRLPDEARIISVKTRKAT